MFMTMPEPEKIPGQQHIDLMSFSIVAAPSPGDLGALQVWHTTDAQQESEILLAAAHTPGGRQVESLDDVFAELYRYRGISSGHYTAQLLESAGGVIEGIAQGAMCGDNVLGGSNQIAACLGRAGISVNGRVVRWLVLKDEDQGGYVIPHLPALRSELTFDHRLGIENPGNEVFQFGEARLVLLVDGSVVRVEVLAALECLDEAVEHFLRALRGSGESSFVQDMWESELLCFLEEQKALDDVGQELTHYIRESVETKCIGHSSSEREDWILLQLKPSEALQPRFSELWGERHVSCRLVLRSGDDNYIRPRFIWFLSPNDSR